MSDEALIGAFQAHRQAFEKLRAMAVEDTQPGKQKLYNNLLDIDQSHLSAIGDWSRRLEYRYLLTSLKSDVTIQMFGDSRLDADTSFIFQVWSASGIGLTWWKGLTFLPEGNELFKERAVLINPNPSSGFYLRRISGQWFVYKEVAP